MLFRRRMLFFRMEIRPVGEPLYRFNAHGAFDPGIPAMMRKLLTASSRGIWGEAW